MLPRDDVLMQAWAMVELRQFATKATATSVKRHRDVWRACKECGLCRERERVVLFRGYTPCDVLFIGDSPGEAEDLLGKPFLGKDGVMLESLIDRAEANTHAKVKVAYTTLVSCVPFESQLFSELRKPTKEEVTACSDRLRQFINIAKPRYLVTVGPVAKTMLPKDIVVKDRKGERTPLLADIKHPWQIRNMPSAASVLEEKRIVLKLSRIFKQVSR